MALVKGSYGSILSGVTVMVPVHLIEELSDATADDLREIEISPAGTALLWPRLGADVYVPSLIQGIYGTKRWMVAPHRLPRQQRRLPWSLFRFSPTTLRCGI